MCRCCRDGDTEPSGVRAGRNGSNGTSEFPAAADRRHSLCKRVLTPGEESVGTAGVIGDDSGKSVRVPLIERRERALHPRITGLVEAITSLRPRP